MAVEIYARGPDDPGFDDSKLEVRDTVSQFIDQVLMVLNTRKTEVMGSSFMGASLEEMIYTLHLDKSQVKKEVQQQINNHCTLSDLFNYTIDVGFFTGTIRDIVTVDVFIEGSRVAGFMVK